MKANRKNKEEITDYELRSYFSEHLSGERLESTIADAKKAFSYINKHKEFNY